MMPKASRYKKSMVIQKQIGNWSWNHGNIKVVPINMTPVAKRTPQGSDSANVKSGGITSMVSPTIQPTQLGN
jgi:hypothetical protein